MQCIDYGDNGVYVHNSLLNKILEDQEISDTAFRCLFWIIAHVDAPYINIQAIEEDLCLSSHRRIKAFKMLNDINLISFVQARDSNGNMCARRWKFNMDGLEAYAREVVE